MIIPPVALASEGMGERDARRSRWGSLVSRIEGQLEDDGGDDKDGRNEIAPGIVSIRGSSASSPSLSTSSRSAANAPFGAGGGNSQPSFTLSDWIARHRTRHDGAEPMNDERREFLEKSVRVLHSLVEKVVSHSNDIFPDGDGEEALLHPNFISSKNIVVRQYMLWEREEVTADFVGWGNSDPMIHNGKMDETRKKIRILQAFGRVAYDLFMMGQCPSMLKFCSNSRATTGNISSARSLHDSQPENNNMDEDDIVDMLRKSSRTATSEGEDSSGIISSMLDAGVPYPLCRFVSDLLDDGDKMLGRSEKSFSSLTDVLADLEQTLDDPATFLHASSPDRWKLTFGEKLYGRDESSIVLMDASDRIAFTGSDPIFQCLSGMKGRSTEVVMVSGNSGSGKSRLVRIAATSLEKRGWHFLSAKFDRLARAEPLSVLARAFEDYLGSTLHANSECPWAGSREMQRRLEGILGPEGLSILSKHIPSLHLFAKVPLHSEATTQVNETMMQTLFGKLLQALSSKRTPILFFLDDLQWADPLSLNMLSALIKGNCPDVLHLSSAENDGQDETARDDSEEKTMDDPEEKINVMFVGSYRDNEVGDDHLLKEVLQKLQSDSSVKLSDICLAGLSLEALNKMLSESLHMPVRRVRPLSELVMTKTDGQPLHVIEFIQALIADNLLDHSFTRGWEWDADAIDVFPITDSVAELFAFKLRRLQDDIRLGLQIVSCFGSQVDKQVLSFVADYDGESSVDLTAAVDISAKEGLIEQTMHLVRFAHDMIQKAAIDSISEETLIPLLRKLTAALIKNASAVGELDSVLFVVVDLINRIGSNPTDSSKQRILFADLNLRAASKGITVPDFTSAANYAESGIAFLGDNHWELQYDLSLSLYETSVESLFASLTNNQDLLMERIYSVCEHARGFSDKFKTHCVWIKLLSMANLPRAIEESLNALELLGEPLDLVNIDYRTLLGKLIQMKDQFSRERKKMLLSKKLNDCNKMRAMKVMSHLIVYYHKQQSYLGALVSCQMIKITAEYGHCEDSVFGVAAFAGSLVTILGNIDEGSVWARTALSLMETYDKNILIPPIHAMVYGTVSVWKEPIQSTLEPLAQAIRLSFVMGNVQMAMGNTVYYLIRSFNSGKNIPILLREVKALARQHGNHFSNDSTHIPLCSPFLQFHMTPLYKTLIDLEGNLPPQAENDVLFPLDKMKLSNNDDILQVSLGMKENFPVLHGILSHQTAKAFIFRDMAGALKYADLFYEHFLTKDLSKQYTSIWNVFYEGLINFHFLRQTGKACHKSRGESAILIMKEWSRHSDWNFKNKLLLMEAESHYSRKEFNRAALCYEASIKAASDHRFLHEEAIASELAGNFFYERGFQPKAYKLFVRSIECYKRWGAAAVARKLENSIKKNLDPNVMQLCIFDDSFTAVDSPLQSSSKKRQFLA